MRLLVCLSAYFALVSCTQPASSSSELFKVSSSDENIKYKYYNLMSVEILQGPQSFDVFDINSLQNLTPEVAGNSSYFVQFLNGLTNNSYFDCNDQKHLFTLDILDAYINVERQRFSIRSIGSNGSSNCSFANFSRFVINSLVHVRPSDVKPEILESYKKNCEIFDEFNTDDVALNYLRSKHNDLPYNMDVSLPFVIAVFQKQLRVEESSSNTVNAVAKLLTILSLIKDEYFDSRNLETFDKHRDFLGQFLERFIPKKPEVPIAQPQPVPANSGSSTPGSNTQVLQQSAPQGTGLPASDNGALPKDDKTPKDKNQLPDGSASSPYQGGEQKNEQEGEHFSGNGHTLVEPPKENEKSNPEANTPASDQREPTAQTEVSNNEPENTTPASSTETPGPKSDSQSPAPPASNVPAAPAAPDVNAIRPLETYPGIGVRQNQLVLTEKSAELETLVKKFLSHLPPTDVHNLGTAAVEMIKLHEHRALMLWYVNGLLTPQELAALPGVYKHEAASTVFAQSEAGGAFVARFNYEPIALEQFVPPLVYDALPKPIRDDILPLFVSVKNSNQVQTQSTPTVDASYPTVGNFILTVMLVAVAVVACVGAFLGAQRLLLVLSAYHPVDTGL